MSPDINSITTASTPTRDTRMTTQGTSDISLTTVFAAVPSPPPPQSPSLSSLQAAAAINAGLQRSPGSYASRLERRRSSLSTNLEINNPAIPAPGEMQPSTISHSGSPTRRRRSFALHPTQAQHRRQPSLGELHQELENEQEAQVNRLLHMIRLQQDELDTLRRQRDDQHGLSFSATELAVLEHAKSSVPSSSSISTSHNVPPSSSRSSARFSIPGPRSQDTSPHSMRLSESTTLATDRALLEITRDESAFYQAETQSLTRENQMLKLRIRELERQIDSMASDPDVNNRGRAASQQSPLADRPAAAPVNV